MVVLCQTYGYLPRCRALQFCWLLTHTHTRTAILWPFVWDYLGGPVPEDITVDFKRRGEDNRGKCADNPAGRQLIRTIDAPTSITTYNQITIYTSKSFMHMSQ